MRRVVLVALVAGSLVLTGCVGDIPTNSTDDDAKLDEVTIPDGEFELHHIDVGQADATLVRAPDGETMLVDSGGWQDDGETVIEYLQASGVTRIDHLVATHAHADHVGGHAAVIEHFETEADGVGAVYDSGVVHTSQTYENYLDAVETHDLSLYEVREGDEISLGEAGQVEVLNPADGASTDLHEASVVLAIQVGEVGYLTTGDAETDVESRLVEDRGDDLRRTVYQAGHHGSSTSSSEAFLDRVEPAVAVISSARESTYGHPHDEVLQRFADRGIETYWTGVHGTVVVTTDGTDVRVETEHDGPTDPGELLALKPDDGTARIQPAGPHLRVSAT